MLKNLTLVSLLIISISCSGIKSLSPKRNVAEKIDTTKLYDQEFLKKMNQAKDKYRKGKVDSALKDLLAIPEAGLMPTEKSTRLNLIGVMNFSKKNYDVAAKNFEDALPNSKDDPYLESQVYLNLGSAYFKQNLPEKALSTLSQGDYRNLQDSEAKKYHQLFALLSEQMGKKDQSLTAQIRALAEPKSLVEINKEIKFQSIKNNYFKLSENDRSNLLESFDKEKNLVIANLALIEIAEYNKAQAQEKSQSMQTWVETKYSDVPEVIAALKELTFKATSSETKINPRSIGVVLPLSGERKALGERALQGFDIALEELNQIDPSKKYTLEVKDTQSSAASAAFIVRDLIEANNVSAVIGGLNPNSATKEYLEAKKHGVLFISLSPVLLPHEEKNHLLIEIPSSIESQVNTLFSPKMLSKLGNRPAIVYPRSELGEAYANEFWRRAKKQNLEVNGLVSFDKNASEFLDPVKNILGIKFTREREEEAAIVNEIARLEKNKNIKRLQNLQPQIDVDWVFVPALPKEAVQILPNFNFFDAFNMNFVGVPSWRSELMSNEGYRYGNVYFLDEQLVSGETPFSQKYTAKFSKAPKFVETISYDSLKILSNFIESDENITTRLAIENAVLKKNLLKGESGDWKLEDDIWIKEMATYKIKREGVEGF